MKTNYQFTSDIMERQFGPLRLTVLFQDKVERIARISAQSSDKALELAFVSFNAAVAETYGDVHARIASGSMMGKTLRDHGLQVIRRELAQYRFHSRDISDGFPGHELAVVKVAELVIGTDHGAYARNVEFYSPDVRWDEPDFGQGEFDDEVRRAWQSIRDRLAEEDRHSV